MFREKYQIPEPLTEVVSTVKYAIVLPMKMAIDKEH